MDTPVIATTGVDASTLRALSAAKDAPGTAQTAEKFEALLATMMVKELRKAAPEGFFGDSAAGDIYSGWLDEQLGQVLAQSGSLNMRGMLEQGVQQKVEAQA